MGVREEWRVDDSMEVFVQVGVGRGCGRRCDWAR